jgi:hypothetical protein
VSQKTANLTADILPGLSEKVGAALQREIHERMELAKAAGAGLDIRTGTLAAIAQIEHDISRGLHDAKPADLALVQSLRGRVEADRPAARERSKFIGEDMVATLSGVGN